MKCKNVFKTMGNNVLLLKPSLQVLIHGELATLQLLCITTH